MKIINNRCVIFIVLLNMSLLYGMDLETFPNEIIIKCATLLIKAEAPADMDHYKYDTGDTKSMDQVLGNLIQNVHGDYINFRRTCKRVHGLLDISLPPDVNLGYFLFNFLFKSGSSGNRNSKGSDFFPKELKRNDMKVTLLNYHKSFFNEVYYLFLYCIDTNLYWFLDIYTGTEKENITSKQLTIKDLEYMIKKFNFINGFLKYELENLKKYITKDNLTLISGMNVLSIYTDITVNWNNIRQLLDAFKNYKNK